MRTSKVTWNEISQMSYCELRQLDLNKDLAEDVMECLTQRRMERAGTYVNTGTEVHLVSPDGRKVIIAQRHADRYTGAYYWSFSYGRYMYGIRKDVMGYTIDWAISKKYGLTADNTTIFSRYNNKQEVYEIISHIEWANEMIKANKK